MGKKCKEILPRPDTKKRELATWKKRLGKNNLLGYNEEARIIVKGHVDLRKRETEANVL